MILQIVLKSNDTVLVCAPSNNAADLLAHRLAEKLTPRQLLRLNAMLRNYKTLEPASLIDFCYREPDSNSFTIPPRHILESYKVVVCTCITSGYIYSMGVEKGHYSYIIVDEAGEAYETEALVPFQLANEKTVLVLAGDHKQLGPIVRSSTVLEWKFDRSLMESMLERGYEGASKLVQSYRAHPKILEVLMTYYSMIGYNNCNSCTARCSIIMSWYQEQTQK